MPQVSRYQMRKEVERRLFAVFEKTISDLRKAQDVKHFVADLLTPTEKIMLAKRLGIAVLLAKGYDYRSIARVLKVSTSTILAVIKQISLDGRGYRVAVGKILRDEELERIFLRLEKSLTGFVSGHPAGKALAEAFYRFKEERLARRAL